MRKAIAAGFMAAVLFPLAPVGVALAQATARHPDRLVCSPAQNGGTLVEGVCRLLDASVGQPYEGFILTSHGDGGTFSIAAGNLPPGLTMPAQYGAAGTIVAGTPTREGSFTFRVHGVDQMGEPLAETYRIVVGPPLPMTDTTPAMPAGRVGRAYAADFSLSGGAAPYTWSVAGGRLPPGLRPVSTDAPTDNHNQLEGTPTRSGTYHFTMKVTDRFGKSATGPETLVVRAKRSAR